MSIHKLTRERLLSIPTTEKQLNPGQIVQGKILKIYPNNKAQIQIGAQKMIAQLQASLSIGERYHFQVQAAEEFIHLKVIGESLTSQPEANVEKLLESLNIKTSKANINFVQSLINEKIPIEKQRLTEALNLMERVNHSLSTKDIIRQMVAHKLPLTPAVYHAIETNRIHAFSEEMNALLQQLRQAPTTQLNETLINQLNLLLEHPIQRGSIVAEQVQNLSTANQQQLFNILKNIRLINQQENMTSWQANLQKSPRENSRLEVSLHQNSSWIMEEREIIQALRQLNENGIKLQTEARQFLNRWSQTIQQSLATNQQLAPPQFTQLQSDLTKLIIPLVTKEHGIQLQLTENNQVYLKGLHTLLQTIANEQTITKINQLLTAINQQEAFLSSSIKEQFLTQIRHVLSFTGLAYEHTLNEQTTEEQTATIKSMLIQLTKQFDGSLNERAQHILHMINGMQLQSVNETSNFIQANLLIPGEKLSLNNDLYLDFESKKTEDGKINPDYCRILFYLDLASLKETIIDMNIQNRFVTITIFNEATQMKELLIPFQQKLKDRLQAIDYELVQVTFKPLQELDTKQQINKSSKSATHQNAYEGFDYRV